MSGVDTVRLTLRALLSFLFSLLMFGVALVIKLLWLRNPSGYFRILQPATKFWARVVAFIWGMKIKVSGPIPSNPFFLVTNHVSYTDILLLCAVCPAWLISKSEVASWPLIGALTKAGPTIYINRESRLDVQRMNDLVVSKIREGGSVGFFPEATTSDGTDVLPFKPSLLQAPVDLELPVHCAAIVYRTPEGSPPPEERVAWVGDADFAPHVKRLLSSSGFTAHIRFAPEPVPARDRKELSRLAEALTRELLSELRENPA